MLQCNNNHIFYVNCVWIIHVGFFPLESCAVDTDNCKACKSGEQKCETCDKGYKPDGNGVCQGIIFVYTYIAESDNYWMHVLLPHPTLTYITVSKRIMIDVRSLITSEMLNNSFETIITNNTTNSSW